jgi:acyl-CoA hydrolase
VCNLKARVNFVSNTSLEVGVRVDAENPMTGEMFHTATAYLTFVAIGSNGKPSPMPPLILKNADDERRFAEGKKRRELRLANRKKR